MLPPRLDVLVPFWGLAGGVIKILDYANHAATLGVATTLWAPPIPPHDDLVHTLPAVQRLLESERVSVLPLDELALDQATTVLFTEPTHHRQIELASPAAFGQRLIHLVQGTRHGNPDWNDGLNYRLLHRPMTRIAVSNPVADAIAPIVNPLHPTITIVEGHDCGYFAKGTATAADLNPQEDRGDRSPIRVLYSTWKSDLGDRIADAYTTGEAAFIAIRTPLGWPALRNRYRGADVFVCTPGPEEGFYLPGLEAMASGVAVVSALVGGNAAYIEEDANALVVPFDDVGAHVEAIERLRTDLALRHRLVARDHRMDGERDENALGLTPVTPITQDEKAELDFLRYEAAHMQSRLAEVEAALDEATTERDTIRHERNLMAQDFAWTLDRLDNSPLGPALRRTDGFQRLLETWGDADR